MPRNYFEDLPSYYDAPVKKKKPVETKELPSLPDDFTSSVKAENDKYRDSTVGELVTDVGKTLAAGATKGAGTIARGGGELLAGGLNLAGEALGFDPQLRAVDPLQGVTEGIKESVSLPTRREMEKSIPSGDITDPSTYSLGEDPSAKGYLYNTLETLGQFAPQIAVGAGLKAASTAKQLLAGGGIGGLQGIGAGAEEAGGRIRDINTTHEDLLSSSFYKELIDNGANPDAAREATARQAEVGGSIGQGLAAMLPGAVEQFIIGSVFKGKKLPIKSKLAGAGVAGAGGAAFEGVQEAGEGVAGRKGSNVMIGDDQSLTEGTFQEFVMGALPGGALGAAAGAATTGAQPRNVNDTPITNDQGDIVAYQDSQTGEQYEALPAPGDVAQRVPTGGFQPTGFNSPGFEQQVRSPEQAEGTLDKALLEGGIDHKVPGTSLEPTVIAGKDERRDIEPSVIPGYDENVGKPVEYEPPLEGEVLGGEIATKQKQPELGLDAIEGELENLNQNEQLLTLGLERGIIAPEQATEAYQYISQRRNELNGQYKSLSEGEITRKSTPAIESSAEVQPTESKTDADYTEYQARISEQLKLDKKAPKKGPFEEPGTAIGKNEQGEIVYQDKEGKRFVKDVEGAKGQNRFYEREYPDFKNPRYAIEGEPTGKIETGDSKKALGRTPEQVTPVKEGDQAVYDKAFENYADFAEREGSTPEAVYKRATKNVIKDYQSSFERANTDRDKVETMSQMVTEDLNDLVNDLAITKSDAAQIEQTIDDVLFSGHADLKDAFRTKNPRKFEQFLPKTEKKAEPTFNIDEEITKQQEQKQAEEVKTTAAKKKKHHTQLMRDIAGDIATMGEPGMEPRAFRPRATKNFEEALNVDEAETMRLMETIEKAVADRGGIEKIVGKRSKLWKMYNAKKSKLTEPSDSATIKPETKKEVKAGRVATVNSNSFEAMIDDIDSRINSEYTPETKEGNFDKVAFKFGNARFAANDNKESLQALKEKLLKNKGIVEGKKSLPPSNVPSDKQLDGTRKVYVANESKVRTLEQMLKDGEMENVYHFAKSINRKLQYFKNSEGEVIPGIVYGSQNIEGFDINVIKYLDNPKEVQENYEQYGGVAEDVGKLTKFSPTEAKSGLRMGDVGDTIKAVLANAKKKFKKLTPDNKKNADIKIKNAPNQAELEAEFKKQYDIQDEYELDDTAPKVTKLKPKQEKQPPVVKETKKPEETKELPDRDGTPAVSLERLKKGSGKGFAYSQKHQLGKDIKIVQDAMVQASNDKHQGYFFSKKMDSQYQEDRDMGFKRAEEILGLGEGQPTEAQKEAGNYKKKHVAWNGLDISIENEKGTVRSGTDEDGKAWAVTMENDYGYIKRTKGADGDHVDVFMGPNLTSDNVFIVNQTNPDGSFDEHKVMTGFNSKEAAEKGYLANYEKGWSNYSNIAETTVDGFKDWLNQESQKKPAQFDELTGKQQIQGIIKKAKERYKNRHEGEQIKLAVNWIKSDISNDELVEIAKEYDLEFNYGDSKTDFARKLVDIETQYFSKGKTGTAPEHMGNYKVPEDTENKFTPMIQEPTYFEVIDKDDLSDITVPEGFELKPFLYGKDDEAARFNDPDKGDFVSYDSKLKNEPYLTPVKAKQKINEWKKRTKTGENNGKILLSLFDLTGQWSKPWVEGGYTVIPIDYQAGMDVHDMTREYFEDLNYFEGQEIYGILAACPCTDFANSGNRHKAAKSKDGRLESSKDLVDQTLSIIEHLKPKFWTLENPVGQIQEKTGLPKKRMTFNPNNFGDDYTKKTVLFGDFNGEMETANAEPSQGSKMHQKYGGKSLATKNVRSETPEGFAYSFFLANAHDTMPPIKRMQREYPEAHGAIEQSMKYGVTEQELENILQDNYEGYGNGDNTDLIKEIINLSIDKFKKPKAAGKETQKKQEVTVKPEKQDDRDVVEKHNELIGNINAGDITLDEFKQAYNDFKKNRESIFNELKSRKFNVKQLKGMSRTYLRGDEKKAELAENVVERFEDTFLLLNDRPNLSYMQGEHEKGKAEQQSKINKLIEDTTQEDLDKFAQYIVDRKAERKADKEAREKAVSDPKTLDDYREFIRVKGADALNGDQLESYDRLITEHIIKKRKEVVERELKRKVQHAGEVDVISEDTKHTKTGEDLYLVKPAERVEKERFNEMRRLVKQYGGFYSKFVKGFIFKVEANRKEFLDAISTGEVKDVEPPKTNQERLVEIGDRLITKGEESLSQDRQTNTARRAGMAASAEAAAERNIANGKLLKEIANTDTDYLQDITAMTQLEELQKAWNRAEWKAPDDLKDKDSMSRKTLKKGVTINDYVRYAEFPDPIVRRDGLESLARDLEKKDGYKAVARSINSVLKRTKSDDINLDHYPKIDQTKIKKYAKLPGVYGSSQWISDYIQSSERLEKIGVTSLPHLRMAIRELSKISDKVSGVSPEQLQAKKLKELERGLIGKKIPGFFPTPDPVVERLMNEADIKEGESVLEPSAGKGDIADTLRDYTNNVDVIELAGDPREILEAKNHNVVGRDFLSYSDKKYDKIVMNPPFENFQDVDHVRHAYELLNPGGRVVAIMGAGVNNTRTKAQEFRKWVEEQGGTIEELPEGSFKSAFRPTGVNTVLVTIDKDGIKYAKGEKSTDAQTKAGLEAELKFQLGKVNENVIVVERQEDLPGNLQDPKATIHGVYDPEIQKMYLVAENITIGESRDLLHHEIVHGVLRHSPAYKFALDALKRVRSTKAYRDAEQAAIQAGTPDKDMQEEILAYYIQNHPKAPLVTRLLQQLKSWFRKTFGVGKLSINDIYDIVTSMARGDTNREYMLDNGAVMFHKVFHGSPHNIEKFKTDKIGAGTGDQSQGWGLYFADERGVAEWYKEQLADKEGSIYEIELKPNQDEYLVWEKPLNQQSAKVKEAIVKMGMGSYINDEYMTGEKFYSVVQDFYKPAPTEDWFIDPTAAQKDTSLELLNAGIRGNKYKDKANRLGGEGGYNYVIFSDKDVEITAKYARTKEMTEDQLLNRQIREQHKGPWFKAKQILKRNLTAGGLLPESVQKLRVTRDGKMGATEIDIGQLVRGLEKAVGKSFNKLTDAEQKDINRALAGDISPDLSEPVKTATLAMRQYIDSLSVDYVNVLNDEIQSLLADGQNEQAQARADLLNTIAGNIGKYVHRSYRAFDDPKWFKKVPEDVLNEARAYLKDQYLEREGLTGEQLTERVQGVMNSILKDGTAYDDIEAYIKESKLGAKDLSILKRRKEIAPEIMALLGEYQDPRINFTKASTKMSRLIFNQRFLNKVKELGMGSFLFTDETRPGDAFERIKEGDRYSPLAGLYTYPEVEQALVDALGKENLPDWYRTLVQINGMVKYGKTVLSPTTAARNWMSAFFFSMANGHFNMKYMIKSLQNMKGYFKHEGDLSYLRKLKELGVVYDTPYAGEMMKLLEDSRIEDKYLAGNITFKETMGLFTKFYQYGDDFWKIVGFENEIDILMKHKNLTREQAEPLAAERIRNTYPTYSMTGRWIQKLRRFPLAGTFVSFPAEIIRTSFNMVNLLQKDLKDPQLKALAMRRIVGLSMVSSFTYALQGMAMSMLGIDDDEEEAIRNLAAPWNKNSNILPTGRDEKGNIRFIDLSFLDPYNYFKRPINALLRDQPVDTMMIEAGREMLTPFFGTDITFGAVSDIWHNKKDTGGRVYNPAEGVLENTQDIADHLRKNVQPGIASLMERTFKALEGTKSPSGKVYNLTDEMYGAIGWRITTFDPKEAIYYKSFEFNDKVRNAHNIVNRVVRDPNKVSDSKLKSAYEASKKAHERAYNDMITLVNAAKKSGLTRSDLVRLLKASRLSGRNVNHLINGVVPPWKPSPTLAQSTADIIRKREILKRVSDINRNF